MADTWAVVLAGGEGGRLRKITTNFEGLEIPKQYCSLENSSCLLQDALARAASVALPSHVCTVVASQHRQWWTRAVADLNETNVIVQPRDRGTALEILLALVTLEMRNPGATLVLLPADHYFRDETTVIRALRIVSNLASADPASTYLMGTDPDKPDADLGYILPACKVADRPVSITGFKEKPGVEHARELMALGALWNLFILVGSVSALLGLFMEDHGDLVREMREALKDKAAGHRDSVDVLYERIQAIDFAADVLEVQAHRLQVVRVPHCGWTDLGTPQRVAAAVRSIKGGPALAGERERPGAPLFLRLGTQH